MALGAGVFCLLAIQEVLASIGGFETYVYDNASLPTSRQLLDFKSEHQKPIGLLTISSGTPVDVRDMITINSDLYKDEFFFDSQAHIDAERVPQRIVHPKGIAAWGHFEVLNDVSKYTIADVFNGLGKKTTVLARLAVGDPDRGGNDLGRDLKAISLKFYTKEGNLDFLNFQIPVFSLKDPIDFPPLVHALSRHPVTNLIDNTMKWDLVTLRPDALTSFLYILSDYGVPDGWRHMDFFPEHTYELNNKHNERWYVKFAFRSEQGPKYLTNQEIQQIQATDTDYYIRDFYNAIENKQYPSWILEMDVLSLHDIQNVDFDPFDVTRMWPKGSHHTVPIGRLTLTQNSDNQFRDAEQSGFDPSSLVPGIPGPKDALFRARRFAYKDAQNRRISRNHDNVGVNHPDFFRRSYNRDGHPPVLDNGRDSPQFYPNSFNGPIPYVDDQRPKEELFVMHTNAVDLQEAADFYNKILDESGRQRLVESIIVSLTTTTEPTRSRVVRYLSLTDPDLGHRVAYGLQAALQTYHVK